ncbi:MAG: hypothetical protein K9L64_05525 [Candidatus Izimaplasma sp.]|nr:hypothetical protein [Candidatus Izimaplasma bacterium]
MNSKQRIFPEVEQYQQHLEFKYLVKQNIFVLLTIFLVGILLLIYLIIAGYNARIIFSLSSAFALVLIFNIASLSYGVTDYSFLKFNKFITSTSFFTLMIILLLYFESPSLIPFLFLAYVVSAIYKDLKVLGVISLYFVFTISMILLNYSNLFDFQNNPSPSYGVIGFFVFFFLLLLFVSTYITIKEVKFFYNEISFSKEKQNRNIDLLIDLRKKIAIDNHNYDVYYEKVKKVFADFSEKINIENHFDEKVEIIKRLHQGDSINKILADYGEYSKPDVLRLKNLLLNEDSNLTKLALKIFYFNQKEIHKKEIFSESYFESFDKSTDDIEIKIISFVVFYVLLKKGLSGMKPLTDEELYDAIINTDFYHFINPRIRKIYENNADVFNSIIADVKREVEQ